MREPAVYIMASRRNGTLYTGVTSDLSRRAYEHREGRIPGFTRRYEAIEAAALADLDNPPWTDEELDKAVRDRNPRRAADK